jgi:hypothetical protein
LELQKESIQQGERHLIVDDLLPLVAPHSSNRLGPQLGACQLLAFPRELGFLGGVEKLAGYEVFFE